MPCQAIEECRTENERALKKTLNLHSYERMLQAFESQLPRVKEKLGLPEPEPERAAADAAAGAAAGAVAGAAGAAVAWAALVLTGTSWRW